MSTPILRIVLTASLAALLAACVPTNTTPGAYEQTKALGHVASFLGHVDVPRELISNKTGGLVSNNTGNLVSNKSGGLISNNTGNYRIASLGEVPLANSLIYLLDPDEQFYLGPDGNRLVTTTDASGDYRFANILPEGKEVIVSALLAGNRRMVGYSLSRNGTSQVNVDLATTYVTEFFRAQAAAAHKTMADYPGALDQLPAIVAETQKLLDAAQLPLPDLTIGNAQVMNQQYLSVFALSQTLSDDWKRLLGYRPIVLTTVAGNYTLGSRQEPGPATGLGLDSPTGVALDGQGDLYVAEFGNHIVRKITPDGQSAVWGTFKGDSSITVPPLSPDGVDLAALSIPEPLSLACDPDGNVIIVPSADSNDTAHNNVLMVVCQKTGSYYGRSMTAGKVYRLGDDSSVQGLDPVSRYKDGPVMQAHFRSIRGICLDAAGNLYVADRRNNLIRRIGRSDGMVTTVAGRVVKDQNAQPYGDQLDTWNGVDNLNGPATGSILDRPFSVTWRRVDATHEELYVWEGTNPLATDPVLLRSGNAIRKIAFDPANPSAGTLSTLVGGPSAHGFGGDGRLASDPGAKLELVDPAITLDVPRGGIALSPDGRYLYFCDTLNYRIRFVDLATGMFGTAAGGGATSGDAGALLANLKDVSGLATDAQGNVYFCDAVNNVVRRLTYAFGRD